MTNQYYKETNKTDMNLDTTISPDMERLLFELKKITELSKNNSVKKTFAEYLGDKKIEGQKKISSDVDVVIVKDNERSANENYIACFKINNAKEILSFDVDYAGKYGSTSFTISYIDKDGLLVNNVFDSSHTSTGWGSNKIFTYRVFAE
ncbi:MAG: hypothetical protein V3575_00375 [Candidatus Absconditabacteria bacterium]